MESSEIEVLVNELEQRVERLRALYEQYFMGIEKLEPSVPRKDVDRRFWTLRREQIRNTGLRFKFNMVVQRYNTYQQYWQRILREIEAGTYKRDLRRAAQRFGADALTAAGRKRLGKMLDQVQADRAEDYQDVDVEFDDQDMSFEQGPSQADFGRIDDEQPALAAPRPGNGRYDEREGPSVITSAPSVGRWNDGLSSIPPAPAAALIAPPAGRHNDGLSSVPPPPAALFGGDDDEKTAPRAAAFQPDPSGRPSEPSITSGITRSPGRAAPEPTPAPRPALLSALAGPVRRAPAVLKPPGVLSSSQPRVAEPTPAGAKSPAAVHPHQSPAPARPSAASGKPPVPSQQVAAQASSPAAARAATGAAAQPAPRPASAASSPRPAATPPRAAPAAVRPAPPPAPDPSIPQTRVRQIYETYVQARRACKESTSAITENGLAEMLRASAEKLKGKHSGKEIDFDVVIKNGKAILKPVIKG